jgi:hypothetical protein
VFGWNVSRRLRRKGRRDRWRQVWRVLWRNEIGRTAERAEPVGQGSNPNQIHDPGKLEPSTKRARCGVVRKALRASLRQLSTRERTPKCGLADDRNGPGADPAELVQCPTDRGIDIVRNPASTVSRFSASNSRKYLSSVLMGILPHRNV